MTVCPRRRPSEQAGRYLKTMLLSADTFILDCGSEVYVWVGRGSNPEEKKSAMINAQVRAVVGVVLPSLAAA